MHFSQVLSAIALLAASSALAAAVPRDVSAVRSSAGGSEVDGYVGAGGHQILNYEDSKAKRDGAEVDGYVGAGGHQILNYEDSKAKRDGAEVDGYVGAGGHAILNYEDSKA